MAVSTYPESEEGTALHPPAAVLIVDDNAGKRLATRAILEPLGYAVVEADSGQAALRLLIELTFAVILMDVQMPHMDGYETAKLIRMRADCEHTPIIFVTAHAEDEARIPLAYASGAVDFIFAPLNADILRAKVKIFVELFCESRELESARAVAIDASRAKSDFVATISHEMRTPLNGVIGLTNLLRNTTLDPTQREYVEAVAASGEILLTVIGDVLDFSKIEAGRLELDFTDFDVRQAVAESCRLLAEQARLKGLALVHAVADDVPAFVTGDRARLRQILLNLLSNAVKFTDDGDVSVRLARAEGSMLRFAVEDTGVGIDTAQAEKLFEAFVQADQSTTRRYGGTGLGLAISSRLVECMGGEIGAGRRETGGSVFWFTADLPQAEGVTPAEDPPPASPGTRGVSLEGSRLVLAADDNAINRIVTRAMLANVGFETAMAENGREAMEMAAQHEYAAILMDCQMPEMDGFEATREIRKAEHGRRRVPIIAMTAMAMPGDRERCLAAGMDDYLSKPVRRDELGEAIRRWLPVLATTSGTVSPA
jgi:signal transduction histidine kinase